MSDKRIPASMTCECCGKPWSEHWGFNCDQPYAERKFKPLLAGIYPANRGAEFCPECDKRWSLCGCHPAIEAEDDARIEAMRHAYELFSVKLDRLCPRPPWWRMLSRSRWERQYRELNEQLRAIRALGGW